MPDSRIIRTEAVTLKSIDYGETSTISTLYTRHRGTTSVLAKGARLPGGRFGSTLQPMSYIQAVFYHKPSRELQTLRESSHVVALTDIPRSLDKLEIGLRIVELMRYLFRESEPLPPAFNLLLQTLVQLNAAGERYRNLLLFFQIRIAALLGFEPSIDRSAVEAVPAHGGSLSLADGSISQEADEGLPASRNALRAFAIFSRSGIENALRLRLSVEEWLQVAELSDAYLRHHVADSMPRRANDVFSQIARYSSPSN